MPSIYLARNTDSFRGLGGFRAVLEPAGRSSVYSPDGIKVMVLEE